MNDELRGKLFLFVPAHLAIYYEWQDIVSDLVTVAFPKSSEEIRAAGSCLAAGQNTAAVFHAMRAAEIGVKALGKHLNISIKSGKLLQLAEWREIFDGLSVAIRDIENLPEYHSNKGCRPTFLQ